MRGQIHIAEVVAELERDNLLPAIIFRSSRSQCDMDAERASHTKRLHLSPPQQREMQLKVKELTRQYEFDGELILRESQQERTLRRAGD